MGQLDGKKKKKKKPLPDGRVVFNKLVAIQTCAQSYVCGHAQMGVVGVGVGVGVAVTYSTVCNMILNNCKHSRAA